MVRATPSRGWPEGRRTRRNSIASIPNSVFLNYQHDRMLCSGLQLFGKQNEETSLNNPHLLVLGQGHGQALEDDLLSRKNQNWNGQRNPIDPAAPFKNWKHEISFAGLCDQLLVICCTAVNLGWIFVKLLVSDQICSCEVSAATHLWWRNILFYNQHKLYRISIKYISAKIICLEHWQIKAHVPKTNIENSV